MNDVGALSYAAGAGMFLVLTLLLLTAWRGRLQGGLLVAASAFSTVWAAAAAFHATLGAPPFVALEVLEVLRNAAWFAFLFKLLGFARSDSDRRGGGARLWASTAFALCAATAGLAAGHPYLDPGLLPAGMGRGLTFLGHVLLAVIGLVLVEQLIRNTRPDRRWAIKFLGFGVGGMFAYDFFLYANALLTNHLDLALWAPRGAVNALIVPLIAVSAVRNPQWSVEVFVSRHVVFHTAAVIGAGLYLLLMSAAAYYIRYFGGSWAGAAQIVFLFGAVVLLFLLMFSGQLRARAKVFLSKHFFRNKYDYRDEWLRFTRTLTAAKQGDEMRQSVVEAVAQIVEAPAGLLWIRRHGGAFAPVAGWRADVPDVRPEPRDSRLVRFLAEREWVVFLDELADDPDRYPGLESPGWLGELPRSWIIVPLMQADELQGFVVVYRSDTRRNLDWEDSDLLKTVGRQAASYLALLEATEALYDSRQFEAFNRLSAYVVHDLKNLVAQLSLVSANAKNHIGNPAFVADAMDTIANATAKMNRLLVQLRKDRLADTTSELVNLKLVLQKVRDLRLGDRPLPRIDRLDDFMMITTDPDRLSAVLEHLVQNAQEATPDDGRVDIRGYVEGAEAIVEVEDTGSGMDARFIAERLFRPFDTTKGNAGMGIGVYETREFVEARGGRLDVESAPGQGTRFRLRLPMAGEVRVPGLETAPKEVAG